MVAGSPYANAYNFFIFDGWLYFESSWGELWRYNGADNPELAIKYSDESGANFAGVAVFDNEFYFGKVLPGYSTKFYKCDLGLNLTEISNLGNEDYSAIQGITRIGNSVFFCGSDNTHGYELWMYDLENPPVMFDLHSRNDDSSPAYLTVFDDKLWLRAYNNEANLWFVDNSNTAQQFDGYSNLFPEEFTPFDGNLLFSGQASAGEYKLMFYDGTSTLGQIDLPSPNYRPKGLYSYNEKLYFSHYEPATGWEPYVYDGSTISMVADIYPGANHSDPRNFFEFNNLLIFSAISAATGFELWAYDGENPPYLVADINEGSNSSSPAGFCEFNGKLYFRATDFTPTGDKQHGFELFVYDKENDPYVVFDICPGTCYSNPSDLTVFDNKLYFSASDGINGYELWVYDGENDPDLMFNIVDGPVGESPSDLKVINNALYFSAYTNANGAETWVYDGVEQPKLYAELNEGYIDSDPYEYTFFNNRIYFGALSSSVGQELFSMCPYSVAYIDETACESFEFFGETLSESGTFEHIEQNAYGCNEVTILNLTINAVTFEIEEVEGTITVTASEATYQWVDCNTAFSLIDGATEATFTPSVSGSYAVEVTQNGCTKTSDCIEVTVTGIETIAETLSIYPNPTTGIITVICSNLPINFKVIVKNLIGQRVTEQQNSNRIDMSLLPNGMYIVEVVGNGKTYKSKVVKQ
jgi:ELWxxDGT repeat protein